MIVNIIPVWNYLDMATLLGFTGANSAQPLLAICAINENSEGSCPTLKARRSNKRRVLRYPSSGPFPPATPSLAEQQQQRPFLRGSARSRPQGYPQSSALRCAAFVQTMGPSTLAALRYKPWEIPLPLQLLPPQAWAWAKALLCEQQQQNHSRAKTKENHR